MARVAALGIADFEKLVEKNVFYVDKTGFIKEWWDNNDEVTLITRPRRFGKTLTLDMVEKFFSVKYANRSDLFEKFDIWKDESYQDMQGGYPVISISLADIKDVNYAEMRESMKRCIGDMFRRHRYLLESDKLTDDDKQYFTRLSTGNGDDGEYMEALRKLSELMYLHYGKKAIILIDEYDTPMLESYVNGFWEKAILYIKKMFHATFKNNPYLERGLMTGITRITSESIFSDLNNLSVVTTTTDMYSDCFGFTEGEVVRALEEFDMSNEREGVKKWYDGFRFGNKTDIYNPWSIINFLKHKKYDTFWMNTRGNALVGKLIKEGDKSVKIEFETLINGGTVITDIDESITYAELRSDSKTIWSWLLATGYVKTVNLVDEKYEISLTNYEVKKSLYKLVEKWFSECYGQYRGFIKMLIENDVVGMNECLSDVIEKTFSYFDVSSTKENRRTEQFYHGFTLGIIADLNTTHFVTSNRESGYGRYDICIEPFDKSQDGIIIEFKLFDSKTEATLEDTTKRALEQIEEKNYEAELRARGIKNVRKYGFAFRGKEVLIGGEDKI